MKAMLSSVAYARELSGDETDSASVKRDRRGSHTRDCSSTKSSGGWEDERMRAPLSMSSTIGADRVVSALTLRFLKFLVECAFGLSGVIWCVDVAVKLWACIFFQGCENSKKC